MGGWEQRGEVMVVLRNKAVAWLFVKRHPDGFALF